MEIAIIIWLICCIAAASIASKQGGNGCLWFGLGVIFGPFGLAFSFMAGDPQKCRFCTKHDSGEGD